MKILVTGSSGQMGSYTCEFLESQGYEVVGLDIVPSLHESTKALTVQGDIGSQADVARVIHGVEGVIHCAAQVSVERSTEDPLSDARTNVLGTVNLLHESAAAGVKRFVHVSSAAVYGDPRSIPIPEDHPTEPISNYGASKLSGERYALAFAHTTRMEVVVMRPFNFYSSRADPRSPYSGVITKFIERVRRNEPPVIEGDGQQTRDFIHAADVALMAVQLVDAPGMSGHVFNCGSGKPTSIMDLARMTVAAAGKQLRPEFAAARKGDIRHSLAEMTKARMLLGFSPEISLEEGLQDMLS